MKFRQFPSRAGFTLIELLIVIGIVAILATITLLVLNPAEMLKQGRDAKRISEIGSMNDALSLAVAQNPNISLGTSKVLYISLPDPTVTCDSWLSVLPALPAATGWQYHCATADALRKNDGSGWMPVDFSSLPTSPFSNLPVDPVNAVQGGLYYSYTTGGSWELGATMESSKYGGGGEKDVMIGDSGTREDMYEKGTNLTLLPFDEAKADEACSSGLEGSVTSFQKLYTPISLSGSGAVKVVGLTYWQGNDSLGSNETVKVAIYQNTGGSNYSMMSSTTIRGTGAEGWVSGNLASPVDVTLGQTYLFGWYGNVDPARGDGSCGGYGPDENTYDYGITASLVTPVVFTPNYSSKIGFFGVVYVR